MPRDDGLPSTRILVDAVRVRCEQAGVYLVPRAIEAVLEALAVEMRAGAALAYAIEHETAGAALNTLAGWLEDAAR